MTVPPDRVDLVELSQAEDPARRMSRRQALLALAAAGQGTQASDSPPLLPHGLDVMRWLLSADPELAAPVSGRRWTRDA